ncbi:MAG: hypothetical protein ACXWF8_04985 [Methylobacter sp.]
MLLEMNVKLRREHFDLNELDAPALPNQRVISHGDGYYYLDSTD